jgi:hypothetical protein
MTARRFFRNLFVIYCCLDSLMLALTADAHDWRAANNAIYAFTVCAVISGGVWVFLALREDA